jgi:O-antigen ligase
VVAAALALPLFYVPGADSPFADPKLAILLVAGGLGLAGALLAWARGDGGVGGGRALRGAVLAMVITTLLAAVVAARRAPGAPHALGEIVRLAATVGIGAAAAQAARDALWRQRLFEAIHVSVGIVAVIGILQHISLSSLSLPVISVPGSTFGNRNMAGEAVALALPFGCAVVAQPRRSRVRAGVAVGLLVAQLAYLAVTRARGAWIGGAMGIAVFLLVRRPALTRPTRLLVFPIAAVVLAAALLPGRWRPRDANDTKRYEAGSRVVLDALDPASPVARTRLGLWRRTFAMYQAHPLSGVGPGNFGVLFPLYAEPDAAADGVMSERAIPRRPHNELLERLAETGPLGLAALTALFVTAFVAAASSARVARPRGSAGDGVTDLDAVAAGAGGAAACLGCGLTAFPLVMPATAALFGISLGVLDALAPADAPAAAPRAPSRAAIVPAAALAVLVVAGALWSSYGVMASAWWRGRAKAAMAPSGGRPPNPVAALAALDRAARAPRLDAVRFDIALRSAQVALRIDGGLAALAAADRALALEPYAPHALAARAAARLVLREDAQAADDARRALALLHDLPSAQATLDTVQKLEAIRRDNDLRMSEH